MLNRRLIISSLIVRNESSSVVNYVYLTRSNLMGGGEEEGETKFHQIIPSKMTESDIGDLLASNNRFNFVDFSTLAFFFFFAVFLCTEELRGQ